MTIYVSSELFDKEMSYSLIKTHKLQQYCESKTLINKIDFFLRCVHC